MEGNETHALSVTTEDLFTKMMRQARAKKPPHDDIFTRMMRQARERRPPKAMGDTVASKDSTAVDNVFGITELAEKILLECRIQDLLLNCQRVSKQWQNIITSSKRLQQALFFQSVGGYDIHHFETYFADWWQQEDIFDWADFEDDGINNRILEADRRKAEGERVLVFRNPFYEKIHHKSQTEKYQAPPEYVAAANQDYERRRKAMDNRNASWKRMFASQPPLDQCYFDALDTTHNPVPLLADTADTDGITLADTISGGEYHTARPGVFNEMVPVVYAKDVVRINYKDGDYVFKECNHDMGWDVDGSAGPL